MTDPNSKKREDPSIKLDSDQQDLTEPFGEDLDTIINTVQDQEPPTHKSSKFVRQTTIAIPGYRVLYKLGQGGMGSVFLAADQKLGRQVAIKVVSNTALLAKRSIVRFATEIQTVAALQHQNIAQLYSAGDEGGIPYFVMEYIEGAPLDDRIRDAPLDPSVTARMLKKLAEAMEYCHQQGFIHRDLKPSNVLVNSSGEPKIADFGLAKALGSDNELTRTGEVVGTPSYMAPEQAAGRTDAIGTATDVYGLGAIMYHCLTGRSPFGAPSSVQTISKVISEDPIGPRKLQPGIPRDLETICLKCLSKTTQGRYTSAQALADDLRNYLDEKPIAARPISKIRKVCKWANRKPSLAALIGLVGISIPAIMAAMFFHSQTLNASLQREKQARAKANHELAKSIRLSDEGSELSTWLLGEHEVQLRQLSGATQVRFAVHERVQKYLAQATPDMPKTAKFIRRFGQVYFRLAQSIDRSTNHTNASAIGAMAASIKMDLNFSPNMEQNKTAMGLVETSLDLYRQALEIEPDDPITTRLELAATLLMVDLLNARGSYTQSNNLLKRANTIYDSIKHDNSPDTNSLGIGILQARFQSLHTQQKMDAALAALDSLENFINSKSNSIKQEEFIHQSIWIERLRGRVLRQMGNVEQSATVLNRAIELAKAGFLENRDNPIVLERYAGALIAFADTNSSAGNHEKALALLLEAAELREEYAEKNPDDVISKINLGSAYSRIEGVYLQLNQPDLQFKYAEKAVVLYQEIFDSDKTNVERKRDLIIGLRSLGTAHNDVSEFDPAIAKFDEAIQLAETMVETSASVGSFALLAELQYFKGNVYWFRLASDPNAFGAADFNIRKDTDFQAAVKAFREGVELFKTATNHGDLTVEQSAVRNNTEKTLQLLLETADKLDAVSNLP